jgi:hypothetical protein
VGVGDGLPELFTDGADVAQVMMLGQQPSGAGFGWGRGEQLDLDLSQSLGIGLSGSARVCMHARRMKNLRGNVQHSQSTDAAPITYRCRGIGRDPSRTIRTAGENPQIFC